MFYEFSDNHRTILQGSRSAAFRQKKVFGAARADHVPIHQYHTSSYEDQSEPSIVSTG